MGDFEFTDQDFEEMDRITDENRRKHPDDPAKIRGLAYEIVTSKHENLLESAKEWLDLAECHPEHPLVVAVRNEMPNQIVRTQGAPHEVAEVVLQLRLMTLRTHFPKNGLPEWKKRPQDNPDTEGPRSGT